MLATEVGLQLFRIFAAEWMNTPEHIARCLRPPRPAGGASPVGRATPPASKAPEGWHKIPLPSHKRTDKDAPYAATRNPSR
ncbi:MAG: hypothetical protein IJK85_10990 [Bacteroidales bacterium]|nr:hypothetical protein [Bacteroidales bacterium]